MIELSEIDNKIADFEPKIEQVKQKYDAIADKRIAFTKTIEELENKKIRILQEIEESEKALQKLQEEEKKHQDKLKMVRNERELENLSIEEKTRQEQIKYHNDMIMKLNGELEQTEERLTEIENELQKFIEEFGDIERNSAVELENLRNQQKELSQYRNQLVSQMDNKIFSFYQRIRRWAKNTAVVPVKDQACYGCFMKLSNQVYLEIIKGEEIVTCPNCGRLVYLESHLEEEE